MQSNISLHATVYLPLAAVSNCLQAASWLGARGNKYTLTVFLHILCSFFIQTIPVYFRNRLCRQPLSSILARAPPSSAPDKPLLPPKRRLTDNCVRLPVLLADLRTSDAVLHRPPSLPPAVLWQRRGLHRHP